MKARDVMVSPVITVAPTSSVREAARLMVERRISAVPVVNGDGRLLGILSEGDLLRRVETGTERHRSWWLAAFTSEETLAQEFAKANARKVADLMTRHVRTVTPDTPLAEVATMLEQHHIKRVPVIENDRVVGIVSRANLVQALASAPPPLQTAATDSEIREAVMSLLGRYPWVHTATLNVTVHNGVAHLWGSAPSQSEKKAVRIAVESVPGVCGVVDNLIVYPVIWAA